MKYLDHDRVLEQFLRITGMRAEDFSHTALLENAEGYVISHLCASADQLDDSGRAYCEYAAAAVAVYDYAFELCLKEKRVMSETGEVALKREDGGLLETAAELRANALRQLEQCGLAEYGDFAFIGV